MKAWLVREKDKYCATVVFAETRGKARALAKYTDACGDCAFIDIEVRRVPQVDKYYKDGKTEFDWLNSKDRIILVKELGFECEEVDLNVCEDCSAKEYCDKYKDEKEYLEK
jgi:hypothetical protein